MLNFEVTLEKLEENLTKDITWRKQELVNLQNEINSKFELNNQEVSFLIRGSIALIYAHWEGSVKSQLTSYIDFLNTLIEKNHLALEEYDDEILDLIFQPTIKILGHNTKEKRLKGITDFKQVYLNKNILKINSKDVIVTKSNLSYEVLTKLFQLFKIQTIDSIYKTFIETLLKDRNAIAHGEKKYTTVDASLKQKIEQNSTKTLKLINEIKNNILVKATTYKEI
ncbi:MAG: MAE_28990/MAE_18760 family HEPN-like nuclease [Sulfurimonas sp.]|nr:MAE_28990/MAE_18760 family HEPN-like nuclease [Sulfurimonas sp.]MDQ7062562.1 MAE_28990/MAE_18760 family HEPN-like nuclease [Sulfurimonas sp.]